MINKPRLEKLIVALEGVKPRDFDMGRYVHSCGSPACVLGYFASRGDLQRKFVITRDNYDGVNICLRGTKEPVDHWDRVTHGYFGISEEQAEYLFGAESNEGATPAQMRRKIRKFIDRDGVMK